MWIFVQIFTKHHHKWIGQSRIGQLVNRQTAVYSHSVVLLSNKNKTPIHTTDKSQGHAEWKSHTKDYIHALWFNLYEILVKAKIIVTERLVLAIDEGSRAGNWGQVAKVKFSRLWKYSVSWWEWSLCDYTIIKIPQLYTSWIYCI